MASAYVSVTPALFHPLRRYLAPFNSSGTCHLCGVPVHPDLHTDVPYAAVYTRGRISIYPLPDPDSVSVWDRMCYMIVETGGMYDHQKQFLFQVAEGDRRNVTKIMHLRQFFRTEPGKSLCP